MNYSNKKSHSSENHNPRVGGSSPSSATIKNARKSRIKLAPRISTAAEILRLYHAVFGIVRHNLDTMRHYAAYVLLFNLALPLTPVALLVGWLHLSWQEWFGAVFVASLVFAWLVVNERL